MYLHVGWPHNHVHLRAIVLADGSHCMRSEVKAPAKSCHGSFSSCIYALDNVATCITGTVAGRGMECECLEHVCTSERRDCVVV